MSTSNLVVRTYQAGDERLLTEIYNQCYGRYSGFTKRTTEEWLRSCKHRPGVEVRGILIAERRNDITGYLVTGRLAGMRVRPGDRQFVIYELCCIPNRDREGTIAALLDRAVEHARNSGGDGVALDAPSDDKQVEQACSRAGFGRIEAERDIGVVVIDALGLVEQVLKARLGSWKTGDRTIVLTLMNLPPEAPIAVSAQGEKIHVNRGVVLKPHLEIKADVSTVIKLIFGSLSIMKALLCFKIQIRPLWKLSSGMKFLYCLRLKDPWFIPFGDRL